MRPEERISIYVGNLSLQTAEEDLRQLFEGFGQILGVNIVRNGRTGESRGFGFVEMAKREEAQQAITTLHGTELHGRTLNVKEARPRAGPGGAPFLR